MLHTEGRAWLNADSANGDYEYENAACRVEVQRTDENEVRLGVQFFESDEDDATVYLTVAEATRLACLLGAASLANEFAAHEAASL